MANNDPIVSLLVHPPLIRTSATDAGEFFILRASVDTPHGPVTAQASIPRKLVAAQCARMKAIQAMLCELSAKTNVAGLEEAGAEILGSVNAMGEEHESGYALESVMIAGDDADRIVISGPPIEGMTQDEAGEEVGFSLKKSLKRARKAARNVARVAPSKARILQTIANARDPFQAANKVVKAARALGTKYIPGTQIPLSDLSPIYKADEIARGALGQRYTDAIANLGSKALDKVTPMAQQGFANALAHSLGEDLGTDVMVGASHAGLPHIRVPSSTRHAADRALALMRLYGTNSPKAHAYIRRLHAQASTDPVARREWEFIAAIGKLATANMPRIVAGAEDDRGYASGYGEPVTALRDAYGVAIMLAGFCP